MPETFFNILTEELLSAVVIILRMKKKCKKKLCLNFYSDTTKSVQLNKVKNAVDILMKEEN